MRVLIAGGGVAGLETMLALRNLAPGLVVIELVAPTRDFVYRPLSVASAFGLGRANRFDLAQLVGEAGATYRPEAVVAVDPERRRAIMASGRSLDYDAFVMTAGAAPYEALPGAVTFWGSASEQPFAQTLRSVLKGEIEKLAFAVPRSAAWPLPAYELALMTAAWLEDHGGPAATLTIVTPETTPLELFGEPAGAHVAALLAGRRIGFAGQALDATVEPAGLRVGPSLVPADRVVALPGLRGRRIEGLPADANGFLPTDRHGRVPGVDNVFAAGDGTSFPVKQGGIAAQQADAVAETIAVEAGAAVEARAFHPVLRGLLLTGREPAFLRSERLDDPAAASVAAAALWWPPAKILGRYLAPFLATATGSELYTHLPERQEAFQVWRPLEQSTFVAG